MGILPFDLVRDLQAMRDRIKALESANPDLTVAIPTQTSKMERFSTTSAGYITAEYSRCMFTARYLYYDYLYYAPSGTMDVRLVGSILDNPFQLVVSEVLVEELAVSSFGFSYGIIDLWDVFGEQYKNRLFALSYQIRRATGSASVEGEYREPPLLRPQSNWPKPL